MRIKRLMKDDKVCSYTFMCPGCKEYHQVYSNIWTFNEDYDKPTFRPSLIVRSGHYCDGQQGKECWCTYNEKHKEDPAPFKCYRCHSFITDGKIEFLLDCSHELAGKTIDMLEIED